MLEVRDKETLRNMIASPDGGPKLQARIAYLATYGSDGMKIVLRPDTREPYIGVAWYRPNGTLFMNGALLRHSDGEWGVHT